MFEFHILTIGQFSRNIFWGESESQSYRGALCTSTLVKGDGVNFIVDPSLPPDEMAETLFNRSGLRPDAIDAVFLTHAHGDHYVGISCFPGAQWYMGFIELQKMKASRNAAESELAARILPAASGFIPGVETLALPGHTSGITAVAFDTEDGRVAVCGDVVMTRDFFKARKGYYNSVDFAQSTESIELLAKSADIVVPGHDNFFIC
jgi:glyoxylase-like metal-dependent hydrolase (beta-lactamase superfamily II)